MDPADPDPKHCERPRFLKETMGFSLALKFCSILQVKYERTVETLGELVREDVKLGTLYLFLNLLTPSSAASSTTKVKMLNPKSSVAGSGIFIPDPGCLSRIWIFPHTGSQISDPGSRIQPKKRR